MILNMDVPFWSLLANHYKAFLPRIHLWFSLKTQNSIIQNVLLATSVNCSLRTKYRVGTVTRVIWVWLYLDYKVSCISRKQDTVHGRRAPGLACVCFCFARISTTSGYKVFCQKVNIGLLRWAISCTPIECLFLWNMEHASTIWVFHLNYRLGRSQKPETDLSATCIKGPSHFQSF